MAGRDIPADFPLAGTPKYPPWTHRYSRFWRPNSADFIALLPAHAAAVKSYRQACCALPQSTRAIGGCISAPGPGYRARVRAELYPRAPQLKETADVSGSTNSVPGTDFLLRSSKRELVAMHCAPPSHVAPTGSSRAPLCSTSRITAKILHLAALVATRQMLFGGISRSSLQPDDLEALAAQPADRKCAASQ